ncbi:MAG: hypothetical protein EA369_03215 [Bradymonadales bacterium]|nr:MAG: hypothetical protein EA369_03215 [Bradymonadales bacterium]
MPHSAAVISSCTDRRQQPSRQPPFEKIGQNGPQFMLQAGLATGAIKIGFKAIDPNFVTS